MTAPVFIAGWYDIRSRRNRVTTRRWCELDDRMSENGRPWIAAYVRREDAGESRLAEFSVTLEGFGRLDAVLVESAPA